MGTTRSVAGPGRSVRPMLRLPLRSQNWAWALPIVVTAIVYRLSASGIQLLVGLLIAGGLVVVVARAPAKGLLALVLILPFQQSALAFLYHSGVPASLVRGLGGWKEAVVAGILLAAIRDFTRSGRRLDALDALALGYIAIATAYLVAPSLFVLGSNITPPSYSVRLLAWRVDTLFVFAFLGARHAVMKPASRRSYLRVALATGTIAAGIGCYEEVAPRSWNHFAVYTLGEPAYINNVLHVAPPLGMLNVEHQQTLAGHIVTRVGSVFFDPLSLGFYLLLLLALAVNLAARGRARPPTFVVMALATVAVLATITRTAVIGAVVVLFCALRPQRLLRNQWQRSRKARFAIVVVVGLVLLSPVVVATGVSQRTSASLSGGQDASGHTSSLVKGSQSLLSYPLGRGIGTAPGIGNRFEVSGQITAENSYLQVGDELGIPALAIFVAMLFLLIRRLGQAEKADDDTSPLAGGLRLAAIALAVGGLFLHVWLEFSLAVSFWGGAGLVIGIADRMRLPHGHNSVAAPRGLEQH